MALRSHSQMVKFAMGLNPRDFNENVQYKPSTLFATADKPRPLGTQIWNAAAAPWAMGRLGLQTMFTGHGGGNSIAGNVLSKGIGGAFGTAWDSVRHPVDTWHNPGAMMSRNWQGFDTHMLTDPMDRAGLMAPYRGSTWGQIGRTLGVPFDLADSSNGPSPMNDIADKNGELGGTIRQGVGNAWSGLKEFFKPNPKN